VIVWHLVTSEYPTQTGGVSDYSYLIARGLGASGDVVHVWCPAWRGGTLEARGVMVHRMLGHMGPRDLRRTGEMLNRFSSVRRLLVQWVPHGYGYRSMNLAFCLWLWSRATLLGDRVELMVHEPYLAFEKSKWNQSAAAVIHRLMTCVLLRSASKVWIATPTWEARWKVYALGRKVSFQWLPVPSTVPVVGDPENVNRVRGRYLGHQRALIGHFGTYGSHIQLLLMPCLQILVQNREDTVVLLLGRGSKEFCDELRRRCPNAKDRIQATGTLAAEDLSRHLSACDVLVQPYPDGATGRRTSLLAGLAHGRPTVTTIGSATEAFWFGRRAVVLVPVGDPAAMAAGVDRLLSDSSERARVSEAAQRFYEECFDAKHTIAMLRQDRP
jgi:glycosyltransferase involved in cell wall biosynthesis